VSLPDRTPDAALHPDDRPDPDESGPWIAVLVAATLAWLPLAVVDWRLLVEGTVVWATVRSVTTLVLAPLSAAALVQDSRALAVDGVAVGRATWGYALVALAFPPVAAVYLLHRAVLVGRSDRDADGDRP
jgi:hypothetical protein